MKSVTVLGTTVFLCFAGVLAPSVIAVLKILEEVETLVLECFQQVPIFFCSSAVTFNFKQEQPHEFGTLERLKENKM